MPFSYHAPHTVINPVKFIRKVEVLHDSGAEGFSLAMIDWEGTPHIGIRWNVAAKEQNDPEKRSGSTICHGAPATKGIPSWFILPRELFDPALFNKNDSKFLGLASKWAKH
jgi:hypothetical protein